MVRKRTHSIRRKAVRHRRSISKHKRKVVKHRRGVRHNWVKRARDQHVGAKYHYYTVNPPKHTW